MPYVWLWVKWVRALCCFHCYGNEFEVQLVTRWGTRTLERWVLEHSDKMRGEERGPEEGREEKPCVSSGPAFLYACDNRSPMAYDDEWVRPSKSVCFCERNGAFKGLFTLRVYEVCVCVCVCVDPAGQNSLVGMSRNTPSPSFSHTHTHTHTHIYIYIYPTKNTAWWEISEKGQRKKGEERECFWTWRGGNDIFGQGKWGLGCLRLVFFRERLVTLRWAADT